MFSDGLDAPEAFLAAIDDGIRNLGQDYIAVIQSLDGEIAQTGSAWLQTIVDNLVKAAYHVLPDLS